MSEQDNEELDSTNQATEEVEKTEDVEETTPEVETEDTEDLVALQEKNKKLFERAKKAEAEAKILKAERLKKEEQAKATESNPSQKQDGMSAKDTLAFINAKVTVEEDIDEVLDYAKHKNISVAQALKTTVVKTILAEKAEQRATAEATNTGTGRRGTAKLSDEQMLANAAKGKLPDNAEDLAEARWASKLKK